MSLQKADKSRSKFELIEYNVCTLAKNGKILQDIFDQNTCNDCLRVGYSE